MSHKQTIVLKPGKEKPLKQKHPWVFSGAIQHAPTLSPGELCKVTSHTGESMGYGYFNMACSLAGRMVNFDDRDPIEAIKTHLEQAYQLRLQLFPEASAYRVVNAEGDFLPGLIIDRYDNMYVLQSSTAGMDRLKPIIIEKIIQLCNPEAIYEKSVGIGRIAESLSDHESWIYGTAKAENIIIENGLTFSVNFETSQKTGLFFDQREMRSLAEKYAKNKTVLNCFCYTGGFTLYCLRGGASQVDSVDISKEAIENCKRNIQLNNFNNIANCFTEDGFEFLRKMKKNHYDFIILDPPAFAKKKEDVISACRGYKDINRLALQAIKKTGFLLTSSCSYHIDQKLFQTVIFQAAVEAKREVKVLSHHQLAADHPISLFHPEGHYLKSLLLYVE